MLIHISDAAFEQETWSKTTALKHSAVNGDRNSSEGITAADAIMLTYLMPCLNLLWLAFFLSRHSGNLDLVQLVMELLIEAENICLTDILAHGFLLQNIAPLQHLE